MSCGHAEYVNDGTNVSVGALPLPENLVIKVVAVNPDAATTMDALLPADYEMRAAAVREGENAITGGYCVGHALPEIRPVVHALKSVYPLRPHENMGIGSAVYATQIGDLAVEDAGAYQRELGGWVNLAGSYGAGYRKSLIDVGILPFVMSAGDLPFAQDDYLFLPGIREAVARGEEVITGYVVKVLDEMLAATGMEGGATLVPFDVTLGALTDEERQSLLSGGTNN